MLTRNQLHFLFLLLQLVFGVPSVSLTTTLTTSSYPCRYPATMYAHPYKAAQGHNGLRWFIYSPDPNWSQTHKLRMVEFDHDRILIRHGQRPFDLDSAADVTYVCMEELGDLKYLVTKQQRHHKQMYQCVQFVVRSDTVVQWRLSAESEVQSPLLCDENSLKLQEAPLIYYRLPDHWDATKTKQRTYVPCALEGGYFISQWGNNTHDSTCRNNIPPTKLESECGKGDGIRYQIGNGSCGMPFAKSRGEQFFCIATWEHKEFTFSIVVAKGVPHAVSCLRFPTMHGHSFTGHIFVNGVCRLGYDIQTDPAQRSITMSPHIETELCGDDTQACVMTRNLRCNIEHISKTCRETCNTCPYPIPWDSLTIARQFHGRWVFFRGDLSHEIGISDKYIEIPTLGKFKTFTNNKCPAMGLDVTSGKKRYVFVTNFENGCSPRLTAIELFKRSDAVISMRLSETVPVDYTVTPSEDGLDFVISGWEDWCKNLRFRDGPIRHDDSFRTDSVGWYNLIHKDRTSLPYTCTFPDTFRRMNLELTSGVNCIAEVEQTNTNGFNIRLETCQSGVSKAARTRADDLIGSPIAVTCLAAFGGRARGTQYLVTRTTSDARIAGRKFMCWSLDLDGLRGLLLPVSDCDDNSARQVELQAQDSSFGSFSAMGSTLPGPPTEDPAAAGVISGSEEINAATAGTAVNQNVIFFVLIISLTTL